MLCVVCFYYFHIFHCYAERHSAECRSAVRRGAFSDWVWISININSEKIPNMCRFIAQQKKNPNLRQTQKNKYKDTFYKTFYYGNSYKKQ